MSRNGSGTYTLPVGNPVVAGTTITSAWANSTLTDIATALTGSVAADGQTPMTGTLNMGTNRITGVSNGTLPTDAINLSQLNDPSITGNVDILGTLHVVGATTLDSTLSVGGSTTVTGNVTATGNGFFDGNGTFNGTGDVKIAVGTTAQRPTPVQGMIRFNTTLGQYEGASNVTGATISTITFVTTTATLTTAENHNLVTGDYVTISGATPAAYNGTFAVTVTGNTTFEYTMLTTPATNATVVGTYYSTIWTQIGGGATGGGNDQVFVENSVVVSVNYVFPTGKNASSVGPITINSGVSVTIPSTQRWVVL
jgi:hypothetical protein